jgi:murein DD-endopeptidase MepM/ murein hydrolase activator NlpD
MRNRFTVTIHDENGVKQFNLHQAIKKVALYAALSLVGFFIAGAAIIIFLNSALNDIETKKATVEIAYNDLQERNKALRDSIAGAEERLQSKMNELDVVTDRLNNIEVLIGLAPTESTPLTERAEIAKLTSEQMAALLKYIPNGSPVEYKGITSKFGYRTHPTLKRREFHRGTDLRAAMDTPVYATADGVVEYGAFHESSGYGNLIILDHNYGFKSLFGHLNKIVVKSGDYVRKGDLIAYTGNSGMSSGPHLHPTCVETQTVYFASCSTLPASSYWVSFIFSHTVSTVLPSGSSKRYLMVPSFASSLRRIFSGISRYFSFSSSRSAFGMFCISSKLSTYWW